METYLQKILEGLIHQLEVGDLSMLDHVGDPIHKGGRHRSTFIKGVRLPQLQSLVVESWTPISVWLIFIKSDIVRSDFFKYCEVCDLLWLHPSISSLVRRGRK